jgi:hypothetical protein
MGWPHSRAKAGPSARASGRAGRSAARWSSPASASHGSDLAVQNPLAAAVLGLQRSVGNHAVTQLLSGSGDPSPAADVAASRHMPGAGLAARVAMARVHMPAGRPAAGAPTAQRDTPAPAGGAPGPAGGAPGGAAPTVADRITAAEALLTDKRLDDPIWTIFRERGGSASTIADALWNGQLGLADVKPAKPVARKTDPAAKLRKALEAAIETVVTAKVKELITKTTSKDGAATLTADIRRLTGRGASWNTPDVVNQLWREWVGPGPIAKKTAGGAKPKALYDALEAAAAKAVPALRHGAFPSATSGLEAADITAVEALLRPMSTWIREDEQYATLADTLHQARGGKDGRQSPAWNQLNAQMPKLVIVAEANIVNGLTLANTPVTPDIWAEFRGKYIATISKTIWRYHADNIVDASIFGYRFSRDKVGQGMHREAVPTLRAIEESALRLSGKGSLAELKSAEGTKGKDQGTMRNPITLPGTEFRFEPMSHPDWMRKSAKISPHGTGRAIDFRSATNPAIGDDSLEVLRFLAGAPAASHTVSIDWGKLRQQAGALAPLLQRRLTLEQLLATEKNEEARKVAEQDLATVKAAIATQSETAPLAVELRDSAEKALDAMTNLETAFQAAWQPLDKADDKKLMASLLAHADQKKAEAQAELAKVVAKEAKEAEDKRKADEAAKAAAGGAAAPGTAGAPATPGATPTPTPTPTKGAKAKVPAKAKAPVAPPKSAQVQALELAIARIDKLRGLVTVSATAKDVSKKQKGIANTLRGAGANGLTDLPLWMVQAFVENGWTWGGSWGGFADAMHFDYLGSLADVIG